MGKTTKKLVLDKNTVKNVKIKSNVKTGTIGDGNKTDNCNGGGGLGSFSTSANYSRAISTAM
jgi:hypothetical protein